MATSPSITQIESSELFLDRLPPATQRAFLYCIELSLFTEHDWYLAGGTALALQVGHRQSVDLDFFTSKKTFNELELERTLRAADEWKTTLREEGTIYGTLMDAKMSFIAYPFFIPSASRLTCGTVRLLDPSDIAAMKVVAISQRGRRRDFIDLYWYSTNRKSLTETIRQAVQQYPDKEHSIPHFLKSLTYFADAEDEPMPTLFFEANWKDVKKFFEREVEQATRELLGLSK